VTQQTETSQDLTLPDLARLKQENQGTAKGLVLHKKKFVQNIDLSYQELDEAILSEADLSTAKLEHASLVKTYLSDANLARANLDQANLQDAVLHRACLKGASLERTNLQGTKLWGANLEGARLSGANWQDAEDLEYVEWGNYVLDEERNKFYDIAANIYHMLRLWYKSHGIPEIAANFRYRELECKRKTLSWKRDPFKKLWRTFKWLFGGYGERPFWILGWWFVVIIVATLIMYFFDGVPSPRATSLVSRYLSLAENPLTGFSYAAYYGLVSFTSLGYGGWVDEPANTWKFFGLGISLLGAILIGLFVVYLVRVIIRE